VQPAAVLIDIRIPGPGGVEATRCIRLTRPAEQPRLLVPSIFDQDENVLQALRAGAYGFLGKGAAGRGEPVEL